MRHAIVLVAAEEERRAQLVAGCLDLRHLVGEAFDRAGLPWEQCHHENRGPGLLVMVPLEHGGQGLIADLPSALRLVLRSHIQTPHDGCGVGIRMAVHSEIGGGAPDEMSVSAFDTAFRLFEAPPLRQHLIDSSADVAVIVSKDVRENVLRYVVPEDGAIVRVPVELRTGSVEAEILLFGVKSQAEPVPVDHPDSSNVDGVPEGPTPSGSVRQSGTGVLFANTGSVTGNITIDHR